MLLRALCLSAVGFSSIFIVQAQEPTPAVVLQNVIPEVDVHMTEYEESLRKKAELTGHVITPDEEKSMQDYKETVEKHKLEAKRRRELHDRFLKEQKRNAARASAAEGGPPLKPPMLDPWLVLGLPRDATSEDVEQAFQGMKAMGGREGNSPAVHMSYHVLIDPSMRARMLAGEMELPDPDPANTHSHHFEGDNFHDRPEMDPTRLEL